MGLAISGPDSCKACTPSSVLDKRGGRRNIPLPILFSEAMRVGVQAMSASQCMSRIREGHRFKASASPEQLGLGGDLQPGLPAFQESLQRQLLVHSPHEV